jgi:hypothetical protein
VSLCRDQTIQKLNAFFVPCFVDNVWKAPVDAWQAPADASPALRAAFANTRETLRTAMIPRPGEKNRSGVQGYIVSLDGSIEQTEEMMGPDPQVLVDRAIDRYLAKTRVTPGSRLARYRSQAPDGCPDGGVQLRMVSRFNHPPTRAELAAMDQRMPGFMYEAALDHPMRDWIVLDRGTWQRMLPPAGAARGQEYRVPDEVAAQIFIHFTSASSAMFASEGKMEAVTLRGRVRRADASGVEVVLRGSFFLRNPGMHDVRGHDGAPLNNHVIASVIGFLKSDPSRRSLTDIEFVADHAVDQAPSGFRMPFKAVAYKVAAQPASVVLSAHR